MWNWDERQDPVCLRFSLYQGANLLVLSDASYRGRPKRRHTCEQVLCQSQKPRGLSLQKFHVSLHPFHPLVRVVNFKPVFRQRSLTSV
jgi:hypothetical protein